MINRCVPNKMKAEKVAILFLWGKSIANSQQVGKHLHSIMTSPAIIGVHYGDVIMGTIASQITSLTIVYSTVYSDADQRKHQSPASLSFVWGIHRGPVNSQHKWPVTRKMFPFDDVIMGWIQNVIWVAEQFCCSVNPFVIWFLNIFVAASR